MPRGHGVDMSYFAMMAYISGQVISEWLFLYKVISTFHTPCLVNKRLKRDTLRLCKSLFSSYLPWNLDSVSKSHLEQSPKCYLPTAIFPSFLLPHLLIGVPLQERAVTSASLIYLISYYWYQYCSNYFNPGHGSSFRAPVFFQQPPCIFLVSHKVSGFAAGLAQLIVRYPLISV